MEKSWFTIVCFPYLLLPPYCPFTVQNGHVKHRENCQFFLLVGRKNALSLLGRVPLLAAVVLQPSAKKMNDAHNDGLISYWTLTIQKHYANNPPFRRRHFWHFCPNLHFIFFMIPILPKKANEYFSVHFLHENCESIFIVLEWQRNG